MTLVTESHRAGGDCARSVKATTAYGDTLSEAPTESSKERRIDSRSPRTVHGAGRVVAEAYVDPGY